MHESRSRAGERRLGVVLALALAFGTGCGPQGGPELRVIGQPSVVGGLDEAPDEPLPQVVFYPLVGVDVQHRRVATADLRVDRRTSEHLGPVARQPLHVLRMTRM